MTANNQTVETREMSVNEPKQLFSFFVEDMMFGLDVDRVLMLDQNMSKIQRLPVEERGFQGITKFQGVVVPVLDFAHRIGIRSGMDIKSHLLDDLTRFEQQHIEQLSSLEQAIKSDTHFSIRTTSKFSEMTQWLASFQTRDETLKELFAAVDAPHKQLSQLAEEILGLCERGQTDRALDKLNQEKATSLRQLQSLFSRIREQVESAARQVLLFVTLDGITPLYALIIDEINDVCAELALIKCGLVDFDKKRFDYLEAKELLYSQKLAAEFDKENIPKTQKVS
jgi:hypothetical protein